MIKSTLSNVNTQLAPYAQAFNQASVWIIDALLRSYVAYVFFEAGRTKLQAGWAAPEWFTDLHFPFPQSLLSANLNWGMAGIGEVTLAVLLFLGPFTRFAAVGLLYITFVAIYSVHFDLGFAGWEVIENDSGQGFKVPLMLALMLLAIFMHACSRVLAGKRSAYSKIKDFFKNDLKID